MFRFFRTIRQKLLSNGKFSKYSIYAIGEIFLVVIGILIALQINNWNEDRKQQKQTQELFILLRESIMSDTSSFNSRIKHIETGLENAEMIKNVIYNNESYSTKIDTALRKIRRINSPESDYKIFDRILSVGIENIEDNNLKNEIQHYYEDSETFENIGDRAQDLLDEIYPKYMISDEIGVAAKPEDWETLKNVNEFRVSLDYCIHAANRLVKRTNHRKDIAKYILKALDDEIKLNEHELRNLPYIKNMIPRDSLY